MAGSRERGGISVMKGRAGAQRGKPAWWGKTFEERVELIRKAYGDYHDELTLNLSEVDPELTEARSLRFAPTASRPDFLHLTAGLSQPHAPGEEAPPWEIGLYTPDEAAWTRTLVFDLLLYYQSSDEPVREGDLLPTGFYDAGFDPLLCLLWDNPPLESFRRVSEMRSVLVWRDLEQTDAIRSSTGAFRTLIATTVTLAEANLVEETSPPHLLLFLQRMGVRQRSDPNRPCALQQPGATDEWDMIRPLTEVQAMRELQLGK